MNSFPIIRVITKLLIPYILLFAFYVQFHGDYGPGGGFQAGVIFAAGLILYGLVFGLQTVKDVAPPIVVEKCMALGVLVYAGTGVLTMLLGGKFLDYDVLEHHLLPQWHVPSGQHLGILLVELGVGITVTAVMTMIFYAFASRGRVKSGSGRTSQDPFGSGQSSPGQSSPGQPNSGQSNSGRANATPGDAAPGNAAPGNAALGNPATGNPASKRKPV